MAAPIAACDVVIARRNVGGEGAKRVEGGLVTFLQLLVHIDFDLVHGHMTGAFDHHLTALFPGDFGQFAKGFEFGKLRGVIGVINGAGAQAIAEREADIILAHEIADLFEMV